MAAKNIQGSRFAGRSQEEILELVVSSAATATQKAVAENNRLGLNAPGNRDGQPVASKAGEKLIKPEPLPFSKFLCCSFDSLFPNYKSTHFR